MHLVKPVVAPPFRLAALAATLALGLGACSVLEPDKIDYKSAGKGVSLEVPPDLTQLPGASRYAVTGGAVTASGYAAGQAAASAAGGEATAVTQLADVQYHRNGAERWISVNRPADQLWNPVRDFWMENGFLMAIDQPNIGIMETDWAENRAKLPQDIIRATIGKIFDNLYSTGERDKFRTRLERNASGGTDIFVTHRGMEEVYSSSQKDQTVWQPRASDVELETEFLRRLMVKLGLSKEQADAQTAAARATTQPGQPGQAAAASAAAPAARIVSAGGQPAVQLDESFDRAWRRVGLALDRTGFTVEDRDRSKGTYFVRYADPAYQPKEPGFFGRLFNRAAPPIPTTKYQIAVREAGQASVVAVLGENGGPVTPEVAQRIVKLIADELK
ncbi:outer membrane protein assembly factor BamC [Comamonadaceae bacterium OH2545_COT-014]|nr:outer membrane protein assembly factor BamC [Comamonadaceae bacterium OH2545_COT-014]